jgi:hypothetical protein
MSQIHQPETELLFGYLNEHYAAARHHQTMRLQTTALITSASAVIFAQGIIHAKNAFVTNTFGIALICLAILSLYFNGNFHRSNRYHTEVAKRSRDTLAEIVKDTTIAPEVRDPNLIGEAVREVEASGERYSDERYQKALSAVKSGVNRKHPKVENRLNSVLQIIPFGIAAAGIFLLLLHNLLPQFIGVCQWITNLTAGP